MNYSEVKLDSIVKQEPPDTLLPIPNSARAGIHQAVPIKLEDLDGIGKLPYITLDGKYISLLIISSHIHVLFA